MSFNDVAKSVGRFAGHAAWETTKFTGKLAGKAVVGAWNLLNSEAAQRSYNGSVDRAMRSNEQSEQRFHNMTDQQLRHAAQQLKDTDPDDRNQLDTMHAVDELRSRGILKDKNQ